MAFIYNNAARIINGSYWTSTTLKWLITDGTYSPNRDHVFVSSVGASELSGSNYTRGFNSASRKVISGKTIVVRNTANQVDYGATNPSWTTINAGTANALCIIEEKTTDADSLLIAYIDASAPKVTNGSTLTIALSGGTCFTSTT